MANLLDLPRWYKFRSFGVLRPGYLKVAFIAPPQRTGTVTIHDVFLDELPINIVPMPSRLPNAELWVQLGRNHEPMAVQIAMPIEVEDYQ